MRRLINGLLVWLVERINNMLDRLDLCINCGDRAEFTCETCEHRFCTGHIRKITDDGDFCAECWDDPMQSTKE